MLPTSILVVVKLAATKNDSTNEREKAVKKGKSPFFSLHVTLPEAFVQALPYSPVQNRKV